MTSDRHGVHMEYKSSVQRDNSQSWYFTDLSDSRLNVIPPHTTSIDPLNTNKIITGSGNISVDNGSDVETLFEILTTSGYDETKIIKNHDEAKANKFMMLPTDWQNFEVTGIFDFMDTNINSKLEFFGRSGRHINGRPCEGTKYNIVVTSDGHFIGNIKHFHSGGLEFLQDNAILGDIEGQKVGIKFIVYNNTYDSNPTAVNIECLLDRFLDNTWERIYQYTDTSSVNNTNSTIAGYLRCGSVDTKMITWGGPIIGLRVINFPVDGLGIEKLSVREIDALAPKVTIPTPAAPVDPEAVSAPTAPPSDGYRTDLSDDDWDDDVIYDPPPWGDTGV